MSWSALAWATDSDVGSSAAKFILILLANKADENYSCYPSIRTLMAESNSGRSTVLRALKDLETRGFISRRPQFHDSGARRSTRYYLNHPLAPHVSPNPDPGPPRPDLGPPGPDPRRAPSRNETGTVSQRHPPGGSQWDPLNPSTESPSEPSGTTAGILAAVTEAWKLSTREARSLLPGVQSALAHGWPAAELTKHLIENTSGAGDPVRVVARRLADLPPVPGPRPTTVPWCGRCEDTQSRTITVTNPDGTEVAQFCPRCSPQVRKARPSGCTSLQPIERW
ncbi:MAG: helix-turn-helix domain-containing protein [Mycobacteriaceae bacterium]